MRRVRASAPAAARALRGADAPYTRCLTAVAEDGREPGVGRLASQRRDDHLPPGLQHALGEVVEDVAGVGIIPYHRTARHLAVDVPGNATIGFDDERADATFARE